MLNSPEFKEKMKKELRTYLDENDDGNVNPVILWDAAKAVLWGEIISGSAFIKKVKTQKLLNLQKQLTEPEQQHSKDPQRTDETTQTRSRQDLL